MRISKRYLSLLMAWLPMGVMHCENPFVQTCFTTDPAPMVYGDRLYVYTGHDEDNADFFWMQEWRVYSTADMVNWTDHGSPLAIEDFEWADDRAWAPQCVERDGKFYFYVPLHSKLTGAMAIGVAVGDTPTGPFKDAIGRPLVDGDWAYIDPTVFIDDDGQAYLYWGNPNLYYVKLNEDMVSFEGEIKMVEQTPDGFGKPKFVEMEPDKKYKSTYTEGPWFYKRGGIYYMLYAAGGIPENISYSVSDKPTGPWKYMGVIMPQCDTGSFTNHCGVADYKGKSYFFYHTGNLPGGGGFGRSIAVEPFEYNADGSFPEIMPSQAGAPAVATFNPYGRVEAETMSWSRGVSTEPNDSTGLYVSEVHDGDYVKLSNVDFGEDGLRKFGASVASALRGGQIEMRLDSPDGKVAALLDVSGTGGWENWRYIERDAEAGVSGVHDVYFMFIGRKGPKLFNIDYWTFKR
ncbi:MAG: glycoside hydrolase family 43 protein [Muribaculaceae bacterium]|nr:glycoside hydrolase family 43 protein [Muribaculaceae bacterium]